MLLTENANVSVSIENGMQFRIEMSGQLSVCTNLLENTVTFNEKNISLDSFGFVNEEVSPLFAYCFANWSKRFSTAMQFHNETYKHAPMLYFPTSSMIRQPKERCDLPECIHWTLKTLLSMLCLMCTACICSAQPICVAKRVTYIYAYATHGKTVWNRSCERGKRIEHKKCTTQTYYAWILFHPTIYDGTVYVPSTIHYHLPNTYTNGLIR